jgi:hypothetical protein
MRGGVMLGSSWRGIRPRNGRQDEFGRHAQSVTYPSYVLPAVDGISRWVLSVTVGCALIGAGCPVFISWALGASLDAADIHPATGSGLGTGTALVLAAMAYAILGASLTALFWRARPRVP